jgi:hypothetical protein
MAAGDIAHYRIPFQTMTASAVSNVLAGNVVVADSMAIAVHNGILEVVVVKAA